AAAGSCLPARRATARRSAGPLYRRPPRPTTGETGLGPAWDRAPWSPASAAGMLGRGPAPSHAPGRRRDTGEHAGIWRCHPRPDADRAAFERLIGQLGDYFAQLPGVRAYTLHRPDPDGPAIADDYVTIERWESPDVHARAFRELKRQMDERDFGDPKDA